MNNPASSLESSTSPADLHVTLAEVMSHLVQLMGGESPREDAARLVSHRLGLSRAHLLAYCHHAIGLADLRWLQEAGLRRAAGLPLAYIFGEEWFYGRRFLVDERVLVPRPETEHLIDEALAHQPGALRCLDVGTGSGCLAITLACELPEAQITAIDSSPAALHVARENALRHGANGGIHFIEGHLLADHRQYEDALGHALGFGPPYDIVVANLPYIPTADLPERPNPVGYEPVLALDGGVDGLDLYRQLLAHLSPYLSPSACVLLEAAPPTIAGLLALVEAGLPTGQVEIGYDYAGLQRFILWHGARKSSATR